MTLPFSLKKNKNVYGDMDCLWRKFENQQFVDRDVIGPTGVHCFCYLLYNLYNQIQYNQIVQGHTDGHCLSDFILKKGSAL